MSAYLANTSAAVPSIDPVLENCELRFQQLLQLIGWSYCAVWLQTLDGRLSWYHGHVNRDKADKALIYAGLQPYSHCTRSLRTGLEGEAIRSEKHKWASGAVLLQSTSPQQASFFKDACIQTVVWISYSSGLLELGTKDAVQEDEELVWSIRHFLSQTAGPAFRVAPAAVAPAFQGIHSQIPLPPVGSEELQYRSDTGSSNSSSPLSELSRQTSANNVLSPGHSTPSLADYAYDIFEQLHMDRHYVTSTVDALPTENVAFKFCTTLQSSLAVAPSTVNLTREHNPPSVEARAGQELPDTQIDNNKMIPMDLEFGPSPGPFRTELQLLPANVEIVREIDGFSTLNTALDSMMTTSGPAYAKDSLNSYNSRSVRSFCRETSNKTSAFSRWTAAAPSSQKGKEKIIVAESLWRRWLRYVVPQMRSGRHSPSMQQIGTHHALLAAHQHMLAERTRRGKQNDCFKTLTNLIPSLKKKAKVTVLEHTIQYVQHLREKVEQLQEQKSRHVYASASHQLPETGDGVRFPALLQEKAQIAAPAVVVTPESQRIDVTYDAAIEPPLFHIDIDVTRNANAGDMFINVLTALREANLASVQVCATYERNNFRAKMSVFFEDDGNTVPHPDELQALLKSIV